MKSNIATGLLMKIAGVASLLLYLLCIAASLCGKINPLDHATPAVLVLVFPYIALLTLIVGVVWLVMRKYLLAGGAGITLLLCLGTIRLIFPMSFPKSPTEGAQTFTLLSYNFTHGTDLRQPDYPGNRTVEFILDTDADIVCLEEMRWYPVEIPNYQGTDLQTRLESRYPFRALDSRTDCAVFSKYPIIHTELLPSADGCEARLVKLDIKGRDLSIINVHLSPYKLTEDERAVVTDIKSVGSARESLNEFKSSILEKLKRSFRNRAKDALDLRPFIESVKGPLIVCGDFNDVPASWVYNTIRADDLHDAFADTNFFPRITYNMHCFWFHIDQVLYRGDIRPLSVKRDASINSSDHYPLVSTFEFTN